MEGWWEGLAVTGMSGLSFGFATFEILILDIQVEVLNSWVDIWLWN